MLKRKLVLVFCVLLLNLAGEAQVIEKKASIPALKEDSRRYFYIPFDVPANTKSLSVSYAYDRKDGLNVLDLGLFDAGFDETEKSVSGFRGWSGGRRNTVFIGEDTSSNGYLPGNIPPGKWQIILGLYKVAAEGVDVKITVRLNDIDRAAETERNSENATTFDFEKAARKKPATADSLTWYRGDLHMHSFHSDGHWTLRGFLDYADANSLDFIGVTDHNTTAHHAELNRTAKNHPDLLVMRGEEVTTYGGHFNVWGLPTGTLADFRVTPRDTKRLNEVVSQIHGLGLLASINHPTALCGGCSWSYGDDWTNLDSVEVWNGSWDPTDEMALKKWDALLQTGARLTAIGSSDSHAPPVGKEGTPIGSPTTFVGSRALTQSGILSAIKEHRVVVAEKSDQLITLSAGNTGVGGVTQMNPDGSIKIEVTAVNYPVGAVLRLISDGVILREVPIGNDKFSGEFGFFLKKNRYIRAEIRGEKNKMLGFTNPIFIQTK